MDLRLLKRAASLSLSLAVLACTRAHAAAPASPAGGAVRHRAPAASAKPRAARSDSASIAGAGARTLEDIHIEGEIPVPQVLFITAREQRRFMEFQHHRYLKSSRDVGAAIVSPSRIVVSRANTAGKEPSR